MLIFIPKIFPVFTESDEFLVHLFDLNTNIDLDRFPTIAEFIEDEKTPYILITFSMSSLSNSKTPHIIMGSFPSLPKFKGKFLNSKTIFKFILKNTL